MIPSRHSPSCRSHQSPVSTPRRSSASRGSARWCPPWSREPAAVEGEVPRQLPARRRLAGVGPVEHDRPTVGTRAEVAQLPVAGHERLRASRASASASACGIGVDPARPASRSGARVAARRQPSSATRTGTGTSSTSQLGGDGRGREEQEPAFQLLEPDGVGPAEPRRVHGGQVVDEAGVLVRRERRRHRAAPGRRRSRSSSIASRARVRSRSSAIATIVWSITAGAASYRPARQTCHSQCVVLPVTRMIQSASAESTLRKYGRPSMRSRSNVAPDLASDGAHRLPAGRAGDQLVRVIRRRGGCRRPWLLLASSWAPERDERSLQSDCSGRAGDLQPPPVTVIPSTAAVRAA